MFSQGKTHKCELCDFYSTSKSNLKKHVQSQHDGIRYFCDKCDHITTQKGHLKAHKKSQHVNHNSDELDFEQELDSMVKSAEMILNKPIEKEFLTNQKVIRNDKELLTKQKVIRNDNELKELEQENHRSSKNKVNIKEVENVVENVFDKLLTSFDKQELLFQEKRHKCEQCDFHSTCSSV